MERFIMCCSYFRQLKFLLNFVILYNIITSVETVPFIHQ